MYDIELCPGQATLDPPERLVYTVHIEAPWENKIIVELTAADMADLDITYEEMDYSNAETKRAIWTILERVRAVIGRNIDPYGKLLIEALPGRCGGCLLAFTTLGCVSRPEHTLIRKNAEYLTFEFNDADAFLDCRERLRIYGDNIISCRAYEHRGRYRMTVCSGMNTEKLKTAMSEYGKFCGIGKINAAVTAEYWNELGGKK
ncbi:MAG: hypothetical protein K5756_05250 [Clostridiales bacterium]|nr:hypothetical protein [Clostridiales bacterium]